MGATRPESLVIYITIHLSISLFTLHSKTNDFMQVQFVWTPILLMQDIYNIYNAYKRKTFNFTPNL